MDITTSTHKIFAKVAEILIKNPFAAETEEDGIILHLFISHDVNPPNKLATENEVNYVLYF